MRCNDIHDRLDLLADDAPPAAVREHLTKCAACSGYYRDLRLLRSGFRLLKAEIPASPSLGFAGRLVRRLGEMSSAPSLADFFERVGRRFVFATLAVTLLVLMGLALPSTGPVRGMAAADFQITAQEAALSNSDPMGEVAAPESPDLAPPEVPAPDGTHEAK